MKQLLLAALFLPLLMLVAIGCNGKPPGSGVMCSTLCDADGAKGCTLPLQNGCALPLCNDGLGGRSDDHKYCRDNGAGGECSDRLRWESRYAIPMVPTNTRLVIRVTGPSGNSDTTWATTVAFNIFLSTSDRACVGLSATYC